MAMMMVITMMFVAMMMVMTMMFMALMMVMTMRIMTGLIPCQWREQQVPACAKLFHHWARNRPEKDICVQDKKYLKVKI